MNRFGLSGEAIAFLGLLGHQFDPSRLDDEYIQELFDVVGDEDTRLGHIAVELEEQGLYPYGFTEEESRRLSLCTEIFNKLAAHQERQPS